MYGTSPIELLTTDAMDKGLIYCQNYVYSAQWTVANGNQLTSLASVDDVTQINGDSDFVIQRINYAAWSASNVPITDPDYLIQISIGGSARLLFDKPISIQAILGSFLSNKEPNSLPFPYLVEMNNNLVTTLTNRTTVAADRIDVVFDGYRVFYQGDRAPSELRQNIYRKLAY